MQETPQHISGEFLRKNPLLPAAVLFLAGTVAGRALAPPAEALLLIAAASLILWLISELLRFSRLAASFSSALAKGTLAILLLSAGAALWILNQTHVEPTHIARFAPRSGEVLIAVRATVLVPPAGPESPGNRYWIASIHGLCTDQGWIPATGDVSIMSAGTEGDLRRGAMLELYGWLSPPQPALNPGAFDSRRQLAADRIFAQIRVPRAAGVITLDQSAALPESPLTRFRSFLREKLLTHLIQQNVPTAYTLSALLLGYRDPAIANVAQSFADAGVAHLLAISGSHIVFFTGMVWAILRFLPLRPRWRELLIVAVVSLYVLATPCGPPILRAALALLIVLCARLLGRPRQYLNMLAAAAILVVLLRPADILDAGFQLSFVTTAALILLSSRVHAALFQNYLMRLTLIADLSRSRLDRWRLRGGQIIAAVLTANLIGASCAAPLVAYHFGQLNLWAIFTGLLALPIVSAAMVVAALQLLLELLSMSAAALLSPLSAFIGRSMIWFIHMLAALPGAALAIRPPPAWLVALLYAGLLLWIMRRRLGFSRALLINSSLAIAIVASAWYAATAPLGALRLTVLSAGDGDCLLLRTPRGDLWAIDAGGPQGTSLLRTTLMPAMRLEGSRHLDGQIVTALTAPHAREAADVMETFAPRRIYLPAPAWTTRGQTLAGNQLDAAALLWHISATSLLAGQSLDLGDGCHIEVLWPTDPSPLPTKYLILLAQYQNKRVLIADPAADALAMALLNHPGLTCDAIIFTGPERGAADETLRNLIRPLQARTLIWCGRGAWVPAASTPGQFNTVDGAVTLHITSGKIVIRPVQ